MTRITPPARKGAPPLASETVGNLDKEPGKLSNLNFKVPDAFHREFGIFTLQHGFKSQTELLYAAFELIKRKHENAE